MAFPAGHHRLVFDEHDELYYIIVLIDCVYSQPENQQHLRRSGCTHDVSGVMQHRSEILGTPMRKADHTRTVTPSKVKSSTLGQPTTLYNDQSLKYLLKINAYVSQKVPRLQELSV